MTPREVIARSSATKQSLSVKIILSNSCVLYAPRIRSQSVQGTGMATQRGWIRRLRNLLPGAASASLPTAPVPTVTQHAVADDRNNVIIQIQGDGNSVVENLPHLTLTRYLTRRQHSESETDLLAPYSMAIPFLGRKPEMTELHDWMVSAKPIAIRVLVGRAGTGKTRLALELCDEAIKRQWDAGFVTERELEGSWRSRIWRRGVGDARR
jgi:hypothetical protein